MKILVRYPQIMKMEISASLEVSDKAKIKEVKEEVYQLFEKDFKAMMPNYPDFCGQFKKDGFVLKDRDIVIGDDAALQDRLSQGSLFQAIFKNLSEMRE